MKTITIYQSNGKIVGCFNIPDDEINLMVAENFYIEKASDPLTQYVKNLQIVDMPSKPGDAYIFDYTTEKWIGNISEATTEAKNKRNLLLQQSDWTQIPNNPLTVEQQELWAVYRQELRDIPSQSGYPFNVVWPTQPE